MAKWWMTVLVALGMVGCSSQTGETVGVLEMNEAEDSVTGSFFLDEQELIFSSVEVEPGVVEVILEANGMMLDAVIVPTDGVSSLDGFASTGEDTQIVADDLALLQAFYGALNEYWPSNQLPLASKLLRRTTSVWSQHPTTLELTRTVVGEEGRGYSMMCSYAKCGGSYTGSCSSWNWYYYADHDGWGHDNNDADAQQVVQLGDHYGCSGDTYYYTSSGWQCGEPDHWNRPYEVGNCSGRCGGGCGGDTQYTKDATDHDGCVRNGHMLGSSWCSDEFSSASDDELYAPDCY